MEFSIDRSLPIDIQSQEPRSVHYRVLDGPVCLFLGPIIIIKRMSSVTPQQTCFYFIVFVSRNSINTATWPAMEGGCSCGICMEGFKEDGRLVPLLLQCGHSCCAGCVSNLVSARGRSITCPFCRQKTILKDGVHDLKRNYALLDILQLEKEQQREREKEKEKERQRLKAKAKRAKERRRKEKLREQEKEKSDKGKEDKEKASEKGKENEKEKEKEKEKETEHDKGKRQREREREREPDRGRRERERRERERGKGKEKSTSQKSVTVPLPGSRKVMLKVIVVGEAGVGKSSISRSFKA